MRWFLYRLMIAMLAWPALAWQAAGNSSSVEPLRIVTLAPHLTEMVLDLGLGGQVVGVSRYSNVPEDARGLPRVGDAYQLSLEAIVALKPSHILVWQDGVPRAIRTLQQLDLPVHFMSSEGLSDVADAYRRLGNVLGYPERAEQIAVNFEWELKQLKTSRAGIPSHRVFLQIQDVQLFTVNDQHFIGQALTSCGAENIFADARLEVGSVSVESVIKGQPAIIVLIQDEAQSDPWSDRWRTTLPDTRIQIMRAGDLSQPVARILDGISALCDAVSFGAGPDEVL